MSSKRFSYLMTGLVIILCLSVAGLAVLGDTLFRKQSQKLVDLKAQNQAIKDQEVSLVQAKKDIEKYAELEEIAKAVVPQDKDQAKTVREISAIATSAGVKLQQISFANSTLGQAAAPTKPSDSEEGGGSSTPAPAAPSISQVKPVQGISGVYSLEITVSSGDSNPVSYYRFLQFLEKLESNRRTAHVSSITVTPADNKSDVTFSLVLNAYLKP